VRILVTGASGQLGTGLVLEGESLGMEVVATDLPELDITDLDAVTRFVEANEPDVVINAAALTAVDEVETNEDVVFAVNRDGAANVAKACQSFAIPMLHYSTDYVFDGKKDGAYSEADQPNPASVYGRSKLASERSVMDHCDRHLVLRTSWVFSSYGRNFVKTMLQLAMERSEIDVVSDQVGKPTSVLELARLSLAVIGKGEIDWGLYHLAQPEPVSWYEFAGAIFEQARESGMRLKVDCVNPIASSEFPAIASRPENSVLDCGRFEAAFGLQIQGWSGALDSVIEELRRDV